MKPSHRNPLVADKGRRVYTEPLLLINREEAAPINLVNNPINLPQD